MARPHRASFPRNLTTFFAVLALLALAPFALAQEGDPEYGGVIPTPYQPGEASSQAYSKIWSTGKVWVLSTFAAKDFKHHNGDGSVGGVDALSGLVQEWREAYPDFWMEIDETIVQDDKVAFRWSATGTPKDGGEKRTMTGMALLRESNGQITESWFYADTGL
ncbi:MAG: ester cyclase [Acidobacteriota bacterium]